MLQDKLLGAILALLTDAIIGDPSRWYGRVPHPVVAMGQLISWLEARMNQAHLGVATKRRRGAAASLLVVLIAGVVGYLTQRALAPLPGGFILEALLASTLLAYRGLYDHVLAVARGLDVSLEQGRTKVAHIVGRDPAQLDEAGVARAAIESAAENFSDGVVAPVFWYALLGLTGLCAYKAINTLDSMIGYRNQRYGDFGGFAARVDDAANYIPARLAGLFFCLGGYLLPGASARDAWRIMWRDAGKHRSPNAGWQEAALAGALGYALAGPRRYAHGVVQDPWLGEGRTTLNAADVHRALHLYLVAGALLMAALGVTLTGTMLLA